MLCKTITLITILFLSACFAKCLLTLFGAGLFALSAKSRRHMWVVFKFKLQVKAGVNADIGYGFKSGCKQTVKK